MIGFDIIADNRVLIGFDVGTTNEIYHFCIEVIRCRFSVHHTSVITIDCSASVEIRRIWNLVVVKCFCFNGLLWIGKHDVFSGDSTFCVAVVFHFLGRDSVSIGSRQNNVSDGFQEIFFLIKNNLVRCEN
ncbi:hypothetical protein D3C72_1702630 [compost metagenome]